MRIRGATAGVYFLALLYLISAIIPALQRSGIITVTCLCTIATITKIRKKSAFHGVSTPYGKFIKKNWTKLIILLLLTNAHIKESLHVQSTRLIMTYNLAPPTANIYDADALIAETPNSNLLINNPETFNTDSYYWESPEHQFDADAYMNDIANMATAVHNIDFDGDYLFEEEILIDLPGENEFQTSSVAVPWRATYTKLLLSAVSEIAKFANLKSLALFKKFTQALTLVVSNFSNATRI